MTQESLIRGCRKSVYGVWGSPAERARAWLCTAPLRRTEENIGVKQRTEHRASPPLHLNPVCASPDAWRATWRSCRLFSPRPRPSPLLLIIIRESDNGYRLLSRWDHGLLRKRGVKVSSWSGHAVSRIRAEVSIRAGVHVNAVVLEVVHTGKRLFD